MSISSKQNLWGIVCLASALIMMVCIWQMIPHGLAGEIGKVKLYFIILALATVTSLASGTAYYYYRNKRENSPADLERMRIEAEILAQSGKKHTETTSAQMFRDKPGR